MISCVKRLVEAASCVYGEQPYHILFFCCRCLLGLDFEGFMSSHYFFTNHKLLYSSSYLLSKISSPLSKLLNKVLLPNF